ncbi:zinc finger RAD18 domain-containing protein C1orf124 [Phlyctochytrium arcticum]|nr:zinc finger RAD18 domain-containing protein C1orf124 [Phlyctochytrium arcticum]
MTLCAGMCYYYPGGYCSVRLSEPLLKLRPRSDYINTLLHEMIHAYLFVTQQNTDRDGHGPEFMKHAKRINAAAGTNITVYHNFRDEVNHYRVHVWKCNGPCQSLPPFFGTVKRSMNRPPQAADWWFAGHEKSCGGVYEKISGPEPKPKAKRKPKKKDDGSDEVIDKKKKKGKGPMDDFLTRGKPFSGNQLFDTFLAKLGASDTILLRGGHIKSDPTLNLKPPSPTPSPPSSPDLLALPTTSPSIIDLTSDPPLLTCPVCQKDGFEGTGSLNSHLDACLLEG